VNVTVPPLAAERNPWPPRAQVEVNVPEDAPKDDVVLPTASSRSYVPGATFSSGLATAIWRKSRFA
jgi:hypothetical protein